MQSKIKFPHFANIRVIIFGPVSVSDWECITQIDQELHIKYTLGGCDQNSQERCAWLKVTCMPPQSKPLLLQVFLYGRIEVKKVRPIHKSYWKKYDSFLLSW